MRWTLAAVVWMVLSSVALGEDPATAQRYGRVTGENGKPIEGATVRLMDAAPRAGNEAACPANFLSVGRSYTTDAKGEYLMEELDPQLNYEIAVWAEGFKSRLVGSISAAGQQPLITKMKPQTGDVDKDASLIGHVTDNDNQPIRGAVVEAFGETIPRPNGISRRFGSLENADREAITSGEDAAFTISAKGPGRTFHVKIRAVGYAAQVVTMTGGAATNDVHLNRGAAITGRLVKDGQSMAGVMMRLAQQDMSSERSIGILSIGTDSDGRYRFEHLPLNDEFQITAAMSSLGGRGATSTITARTSADADSTIDAGELNVEPGVTVSGRFVLPQGVEKIIAGTKVNVSQGNLSSGSFPIAADNTFKIAGLHAGVVQLDVGYGKVRISPTNKSYFPGNQGLLGRVDEDMSIVIKLDPPNDNLNRSWSGEMEQALRNQLLEGTAEEEVAK